MVFLIQAALMNSRQLQGSLTPCKCVVCGCDVSRASAHGGHARQETEGMPLLDSAALLP